MTGGGLGKRAVFYEGEELEFFCSDEELAEFMEPASLDALWWRKQTPEFRAEWTDASVGLNAEEIVGFKREMYAAREVERRAGANFSRLPTDYDLPH